MTFRPLSPFRPFDPFKYGARTLASQVRALFANGEQGAIYGTDFSTLFQDAAGTVPVTAVEQQVGYRLDMSGRGNHLVQATATKRAYVSRRVNLLTKTEDFSHAEWTKAGTVVSLDAAVAPNGTQTADAVNIGATGNYRYVRTATAKTINGKYYSRIYAKYDGHRYIVALGMGAGNIGALFDLQLGSVSNVYSTSEAKITPLADGWYLLEYSPVSSEASIGGYWLLTDGNTLTGTQSEGRVLLWGASLTLAIDSHLPYQRVNTATDYDADPSKFPTLERYDGIDDSASSSTGGGGAAGFFFSSAITVSGGAGTNRVLFSDAGTNTGYIVRINASNQLELAAGNGTAYTTVASVATLTVPVNAVVQAWDDGTNLNVRINDGAVASVARPTVSAGTAGYTIGQDNGASTGYFNGREYSTIYRKDSGLTADQRDKVRRYQLQQARFA